MKSQRLLLVCFLSILLLFGLFAVFRVSAGVDAPLVVNTLEDELNDDGDCSLREAIAAANDNTPVDACGTGELVTDTITFSVSGTIILTDQLSVMAAGPLVIAGGEAITVSGNHSVRVFSNTVNSELTLLNLSVINGEAVEGAGIYNQGSLWVINSIFSGNEGTGADDGGGGIFNGGRAVIIESNLYDNSATGEFGAGGAIFNSGTLTITNSILSGNSATDDGGGIYNDRGTLTITNSTLSDNSAAHGGGGIFNIDGTLDITNSTLSNNLSPNSGSGGGIYNQYGSLNIAKSTLSGNSTTQLCGGIYTFHGSLTIMESTLTNNNAGEGGGLCIDYGAHKIYNSTLSGNIADDGGGILIYTGTLTITNSIIYGNIAKGGYETGAGGGIYNWEGTLNLFNSTISGNNAADDGGGIYNREGPLIVINSTLSGNSAQSGSGIYNLQTATLYNTIVADSPTGDNCQGSITDGGHNLEDADTCGFDPANDSLPNTDPLLGELANNGGPTWTHALYLGSLAIDAADPAHCPETDQRGVSRPLDGDEDGIALCDIGSFEFFQVPTTTTITSDQPDPSLPGQPFTITFTVTSSFGTPSGAVTVTVAGETDTCTDLLEDGAGTCSLALETPGTYTLTADYAGDGSFLPSSDTEEHSVVKAETTTTITSDQPDPSLPGQPFTVTFVVTSSSGTPSGAVTVTVAGETDSCTSTLMDGMGSCSMAIQVPGIYTLTANYPGDEVFEASSDTEAHLVEPIKLYLPFVERTSFSNLIELVVTDEFDGWYGYPTTYWVYGTVENLITAPIYDVTVGINVIEYPYCEPPEDCEPYLSTRLVNTAFHATLPGQINPFSWSETWGKHSLSIGPVYIAGLDMDDINALEYSPLTIVQWSYEDWSLTGAVRNDTDQVLLDGRVVVFAEECPWRDTSLTTTELQPGEQTDFSLEYFCGSDDLILQGQGIVDLSGASE